MIRQRGRHRHTLIQIVITKEMSRSKMWPCVSSFLDMLPDFVDLRMSASCLVSAFIWQSQCILESPTINRWPLFIIIISLATVNALFHCCNNPNMWIQKIYIYIFTNSSIHQSIHPSIHPPSCPFVPPLTSPTNHSSKNRIFHFWNFRMKLIVSDNLMP